MTSSRPYLIRALLEWIGDNDGTPYLLVAADVEGVAVPPDHVKNGRIVLNVSAAATRNFRLDDDVVEFDSRFNGKPFHVVAPLGAVAAVYAKENGEGMAFEVEQARQTAPPKGKPEAHRAPVLKLVE